MFKAKMFKPKTFKPNTFNHKTFKQQTFTPKIFTSMIFRPKMFTPLVGMTTAALIAVLIVFAIYSAPKSAFVDVGKVLPQTSARSDRLRVPVKGAACSQRGWPDFEQNCQFDFRESAGTARAVRVIAMR
jgi:hypothetical protein